MCTEHLHQSESWVGCKLKTHKTSLFLTVAMKVETLTQCFPQGLARRYLKQNWEKVREWDIIQSRQVVSDGTGSHFFSVHEHWNVQRRSLRVHRQIYDHERMILGGLGELWGLSQNQMVCFIHEGWKWSKASASPVKPPNQRPLAPIYQQQRWKTDGSLRFLKGKLWRDPDIDYGWCTRATHRWLLPSVRLTCWWIRRCWWDWEAIHYFLQTAPHPLLPLQH